MATSSSGNPNAGRGSDLAIFLGIWTHSFCRLLLNAVHRTSHARAGGGCGPQAVIARNSGIATPPSTEIEPLRLHNGGWHSVTTAWFLRMVQRTGRAARLPFPIHPHMLRHSTGYKLANQGEDTRSLAHYLGHRNLQSTARYTALAPGRFAKFWQD